MYFYLVICTVPYIPSDTPLSGDIQRIEAKLLPQTTPTVRQLSFQEGRPCAASDPRIRNSLAVPLAEPALALMETESEIAALREEAVRLESALQGAVSSEATAKAAVSTAETALTIAGDKSKAADEAVAMTTTQIAAASAERARLDQKVKDTASEVEAMRARVRKFGGAGSGTGETATPEAAASSAEEAAAADVNSSAVQKLSDRELGEVRKLARPPQVVRRALELVQMLLKAADGSDVTLRPVGEEADWSDLQNMLAKPDFKARILALTPLALSQNTTLLTQISERYPALKDAANQAPMTNKRRNMQAKLRRASTQRRGSVNGVAVPTAAPAAGGPSAAPAADGDAPATPAAADAPTDAVADGPAAAKADDPSASPRTATPAAA